MAMEALYVTLGNLFHRLRFELGEIDEEDMRVAHDFFSASGWEGGEGGLKVLLK